MHQLATGNEIPIALVADDDPITRLLIRRLMEQMGFEVVEASDGETAVSEFRRTTPSIVVTDVKMPKMDGISASAEIRKLPGAGDVPIIVVSGVDDGSVASRAREAGVSTFLKKPINLADLRQAVSGAAPARAARD